MVRYTPGDALGIVGGWFVAVLEDAAVGPLAGALIELAAKPEGAFDELLDALGRSALRDLPDFAICFLGDAPARTLVRGELTVVGSDGTQAIRLDGAGLRTWREASISRSAPVVIGRVPAREEEAVWWITAGVVPVASVVLPSLSTAQVPVAPAHLPRAVPAAENEVGATSSTQGPGVAVGPEPVNVTSPTSEVVPSSEPEVPTDVGAVLDAARVHEPAVEDAGSEPHADVRNEDPSDETILPLGDVEQSIRDQPVGLQLGTRDWSADWLGLDEPEADPYADMWLSRAKADVEGAAVRQEDGESTSAQREGPPAPMVDPNRPGDHDGHTRGRAELVSDDVAAPESRSVGDASGVASSPCINGHANPPFAVTCRTCLSPVHDRVERVPRADAGVLVLPDGERIQVDRTIVVGRKPTANGLFAGDPPRLVALSDEPDVSRTHVIIELSGWQATVTDQDSKHGTQVQLPGRQPERLRPHEPVAVVVGARIVLADDVTLKLDGG